MSAGSAVANEGLTELLSQTNCVISHCGTVGGYATSAACKWVAALELVVMKLPWDVLLIQFNIQ